MNIPATDIQQDFSLSLTRKIKAPREKVFQAFTDPTLLTQWFGPKEVTTTDAQVDLKIGGRYQLTMQEPNGNIINHGGEYREIIPPEKLVFTWVLEGQGCEGSQGEYAETIVTIEFQDIGSSTRLILSHDFLPSTESKEAHTQGWIGCLDCLEETLG